MQTPHGHMPRWRIITIVTVAARQHTGWAGPAGEEAGLMRPWDAPPAPGTACLLRRFRLALALLAER